jgi:hypothetical protein
MPTPKDARLIKVRKMSDGIKIDNVEKTNPGMSQYYWVILIYRCSSSEEENFTLKMGTVMYIETRETASTHDTIILVHKIVSNSVTRTGVAKKGSSASRRMWRVGNRNLRTCAPPLSPRISVCPSSRSAEGFPRNLILQGVGMYRQSSEIHQTHGHAGARRMSASNRTRRPDDTQTHELKHAFAPPSVAAPTASRGASICKFE